MSHIFDRNFPVCTDPNMGGNILSAEYELEAAVAKLRDLVNRVEDQELRKEILAELDKL